MKIAVLRIRGSEGVNRDIEKTLQLLHLYKRNYCAIVGSTPSIRGMLTKAKDYITYGTIDDSLLKTLYEKRGEEYKGEMLKKTKYVEFEGKKYKPFFRMHPPIGGFERKGIKTPFGIGGALGNRKEKINILLNKML